MTTWDLRIYAHMILEEDSFFVPLLLLFQPDFPFSRAQVTVPEVSG